MSVDGFNTHIYIDTNRQDRLSVTSDEPGGLHIGKPRREPYKINVALDYLSTDTD